jgi:hypothetical protein
MTTLREAAQQALEALEEYQEKGAPFWACDAAVAALRDALAQEERERANISQNLQSRHDAAKLLEERRQEITAEVLMEREACADICDQHASVEGIAQRCAEQIRARSKT